MDICWRSTWTCEDRLSKRGSDDSELYERGPSHPEFRREMVDNGLSGKLLLKSLVLKFIPTLAPTLVAVGEEIPVIVVIVPRMLRLIRERPEILRIAVQDVPGMPRGAI